MTIELIKGLLSIFALVIFFAWILWGRLAGQIVLLVSVVAIFIAAWSFGDYSISSLLFLFISIAYLSHHLVNKIKEVAHKEKIGVEQIQKNKNILTDGIISHRGVQDALKKKMQRFSQLKDLISNLSSRLAIEEVSGIVAEAAFSTIGKSDSAYFYIVDVQLQKLALKATRQVDESQKIKNKTGDMFDQWVFKQRQPLMIQDVRKDYRFDLNKNGQEADAFKSLIAVPLISDEKVIGLLRLDNRRADTYVPDDLRLLDIIANIAAVSLQNALLYHRTEELAVKDGLTGIYVHRYFKQRLIEEITRGLRSTYPVSILMLDIDYFKAYNDKYGHRAGDIVLKKVAAIIEGMVSDSGDIVARYGGEELSVIVVNKNRADAAAFAESIRKTIENEDFLLRREKTRVTVSIGVASCPEDAKIAEDLIKVADDALYKAKRAGRNCIAIK